MHRFPLREVKNAAELDAAHAVLKPLFVRGEENLTTGESDYLGALSVLVHDYETRRYRVALDRGTTAEKLKHLMESAGLTAAALGKIAGLSRSGMSMVLCGDRQPSKAAILKLAAHFKLEPGYFM